MDIKLIVQSGERNGQIIPIDVHEYFIGRDPDCHHVIDHNLIDPRHCRIHLFGGRVSLTDLKTEHGTVVNDQYISAVELRDGDRVKVGPTNFLVSIEAEPRDLDRRVQDWCVSTLDSRNSQTINTSMKDSPVDEATAEMARKILGKLSHREGVTEGRKRLRVGESRGITVVKFVDNSIVQDTDVNDIDHELTDLVESGVRQVVLNFFNVENLSSQIVGPLMKVNSQCVDHGGLMKICNLKPKVASVFSMTGVDKLTKIVRDEKTALEGDWPIAPVDPTAKAAPPPGVLWDPDEEALMNETVGVGIGAAGAPQPAIATLAAPAVAPAPSPAPSTLVAPRPAPPAPRDGPPSGAGPSRGPSRVCLVVAGGKAEGKVIDIPTSRFFIGSDQSCQLRPKSPLVGRMHAVIERRDGQVFVRDLGSESGTVLNDRTLKGDEIAARDGDRLQIGPLLFTFAIGARPAPGVPKPTPVDDLSSSWLFKGASANPMDDLAASWLFEGQPKAPLVSHEPDRNRLEQLAKAQRTPAPGSLKAPSPATAPATLPAPSPSPKPKAAVPVLELLHLNYEVIQDVLVITILTPDLNDESTVAPLRAEIQSLFESEAPRRVVINLESVTYLSSRAVGMILAHFQRLERVGGSLRLCHVRPKVMPTLEQMRLPMLIDIYPSIDEALLDAW